MVEEDGEHPCLLGPYEQRSQGLSPLALPSHHLHQGCCLKPPTVGLPFRMTPGWPDVCVCMRVHVHMRARAQMRLCVLLLH